MERIRKGRILWRGGGVDAAWRVERSVMCDIYMVGAPITTVVMPRGRAPDLPRIGGASVDGLIRLQKARIVGIQDLCKEFVQLLACEQVPQRLVHGAQIVGHSPNVRRRLRLFARPRDRHDIVRDVLHTAATALLEDGDEFGEDLLLVRRQVGSGGVQLVEKVAVALREVSSKDGLEVRGECENDAYAFVEMIEGGRRAIETASAKDRARQKWGRRLPLPTWAVGAYRSRWPSPRHCDESASRGWQHCARHQHLLIGAGVIEAQQRGEHVRYGGRRRAHAGGAPDGRRVRQRPRQIPPRSWAVAALAAGHEVGSHYCRRRRQWSEIRSGRRLVPCECRAAAREVRRRWAACAVNAGEPPAHERGVLIARPRSSPEGGCLTVGGCGAVRLERLAGGKEHRFTRDANRSDSLDFRAYCHHPPADAALLLTCAATSAVTMWQGLPARWATSPPKSSASAQTRLKEARGRRECASDRQRR
eukprot:scaffold86504_cov26-Tisochrysis_lutea.AAC.3